MRPINNRIPNADLRRAPALPFWACIIIVSVAIIVATAACPPAGDPITPVAKELESSEYRIPGRHYSIQRVTFPDGLECVTSYKSGMSCGWARTKTPEEAQ